MDLWFMGPAVATEIEKDSSIVTWTRKSSPPG